jgi:hypothetical protein
MMSRVRRGERRAVRRARRAGSHAVGIARRTLNPRRFRREPFDDVSLAHKVESELSRRARVPKGQIVVNAEDGVVFLLGVIEQQEDIPRLGDATRRWRARGGELAASARHACAGQPPEARTAAVSALSVEFEHQSGGGEGATPTAR